MRFSAAPLCLFLMTLSPVFASQSQAAEIPVISCEGHPIQLNNVYNLRTYSQGSVKVFEIVFDDQPAITSALAVTIDRGGATAKAESFCRLIPGFSTVDISKSRLSFNIATNALGLTLETTRLTEKGLAVPKILTLTIQKAASTEAGLVKAELN